MLAIGRILRTGARLLMLDEPTEGLAPVIIQQIGKTIEKLKARGFTITCRTEFSLGLGAGGPFLRHGARQDRRVLRQRRSRGQ
jgi:ABC-type branched-subunit amino acid transport system ATPase component